MASQGTLPAHSGAETALSGAAGHIEDRGVAVDSAACPMSGGCETPVEVAVQRTMPTAASAVDTSARWTVIDKAVSLAGSEGKVLIVRDSLCRR